MKKRPHTQRRRATNRLLVTAKAVAAIVPSIVAVIKLVMLYHGFDSNSLI